MQVLCSRKFTKCPTGTFWLKLVAIIHRIAPEQEAKQRGKDAPGSATKTRNLRRTEARKEASSYLAALGLDKPADKDEWRTVLREMGSFLATKVFLTNCPAPVMEMPVAPVHDSKEAMRFRAICDERITIPLDALKQFPEVHSKLVGQLPQSAMVDVKVNWRCNVTHTWAAEVPASEAYSLYAKLHYSHETILALGCHPPGASGPVGGLCTHAGRQSEEEGGKQHGCGHSAAGSWQRDPASSGGPGQCDSSLPAPHCQQRHLHCWQRMAQKALPGSSKDRHFFWGEAECGLILPSISAWEVVAKEKGATRGGYMCRYCQGFWKASRGGSRFLQITGEHRGSLASLQLVLDEPPEALYNKWIKERMEFYKRVEPCAAPRDERLELVGKMNQRLRFSTSNNLGAVSDAIWQVILSNEEMKGIRAIQQVAQKVTAAA